MPSLSSLALAFLTRSVCLLAYSGLRFPSSTYFMATSTSCRSLCAKDQAIICVLATDAHPVSRYHCRVTPHGQACLCCHALARNCHKADLPRRSENCAVCSLAATARAQVAHRHADQAPGTAFLHD